MTHYTVQFKSTVGSLEQERFQGTLENWRGTHQLEFCWQAVRCTGGGNRKRPLTEFQMDPENDVHSCIFIKLCQNTKSTIFKSM